MVCNSFTPEEKRVIENKATLPAFVGKYDNFKKRVHIFVVNAMPSFFHPRANSMRVLVGQLLTIASLVH